MTVRILAYLGIWAALALAVVFGIAVPRVGQAGMLKCETDWLYDYDEMALRAAALKVLPKSVHLVVTGACRNPDWAYGFIETKKITTQEGVQQWWQFNCQREPRMWKCEQPEFKQLFALSVSIAGVSHLVELSFGKESSLERVRDLASRAIEVYADPVSRLPACGTKGLKESDQLGKWDHHGPLPTGDNAIHISVSSDAKDSVDLDDVDVRIEFRPTADTAGFEAECWWIVVIVT